jgi:hypothetical protein
LRQADFEIGRVCGASKLFTSVGAEEGDHIVVLAGDSGIEGRGTEAIHDYVCDVVVDSRAGE